MQTSIEKLMDRLSQAESAVQADGALITSDRNRFYFTGFPSSAGALLVVSVSATAQTSSINAFSPYSMYGIGELQTPGVTAMRSMGGVGLGMRSTLMVNPLNPAAYSMTPQQGFLFDFGIEGANFYNSQHKYGTAGQTTARTSYNTFNFHNL